MSARRARERRLLKAMRWVMKRRPWLVCTMWSLKCDSIARSYTPLPRTRGKPAKW